MVSWTSVPFNEIDSKVGMNLEKKQLKFYVETERRNGLTPADILHKLERAWPDQELPSLRTVQEWCRQWSSGDVMDFDRPAGSGRPRTSRTPENIQIVKELIELDRQLSCEDIADLSGIPSSTVHRILTQDLGLRSLLAHWVPHELTEDQKKARVICAKAICECVEMEKAVRNLLITDEKWLYHRSIGSKNSNRAWVDTAAGDQRPQVARRSLSDKKTMIIVGVCFDGKSHVEVVEKGSSVDGERYCRFLANAFRNFRRLRSGSLEFNDASIQHDNARPHISHHTMHYIEQRGAKLLRQSPYSPDFNMLDRFVFAKMEQLRVKINFNNEEDVKTFATDVLKEISIDDWKRERVKLMDHLNAVIQAGGSYL